MSRKGKSPAPRPLTDEDFESLCTHISLGKSLRSWSEENGRDPAVIVRWIQRDEGRNKGYREARKMQADAHIDQLIELSDQPVPTDHDGRTDSAAVQQRRLQIDTRKWIASKFHPALYGEKVDINANVSGSAMKPDEVMGKIVALFANHGLRVEPATDDEQPD